MGASLSLQPTRCWALVLSAYGGTCLQEEVVVHLLADGVAQRLQALVQHVSLHAGAWLGRGTRQHCADGERQGKEDC